ncbi:DUF2490 domain-containing protein [Caulobacter soli]|uniref:DUF2490 domain-containing protein n=1 Tax=Caulobacter soli TaxID=2708539 RepID=UPI0013EA31DD|nr:DUF2490 domain-containing protein [Caulobacter soli]
MRPAALELKADDAARGPSYRTIRGMTVKCAVASLAICCALALSDRCEAREDGRDYQAWVNVSLITPMAAKTELKLDGFVQLPDDGSRPARELVRGVVRTKVRERLMVGGGYVWTHVDVAGASFDEHRAVEQLDFSQPLAWRGTVLTSRTQMEERFRGGERGMSLRLRQLTRLDVPIAKPGVSLVAWNEYFQELRDTTWAGGAGPGLMLNFVGMHVPVSSRVSVEPGYLNQTTFTPGRNPVIHAVAIYVTVRR